MIEKVELNKIFQRYYHACGLIRTGDNIDLERALIGIDNAFEHAVKFQYNLSNVGFKTLINKLIGDSFITSAEYDRIKEYHLLRNKVYHEPSTIEFEENLLIGYRNIYEKCFSKIFNRHPLCLFLPWDEDQNLIKNFLRHWKLILKSLYNYYITEFQKGGLPHPPNQLDSWTGLAYYHGIIDDDDDFLIENTKEFIGGLFRGNFVSNPKIYIETYEKDLKKLKKKIREEIIYFYMYYDTRLK